LTPNPIVVYGVPGTPRFRNETGSVVRGSARGLPLGIEEDSEYEVSSIALDSKDTLLFYTDGIVEAFDAGGEQYGEERLKRQLRDHGASSPESVCTNVRRDIKDHCKEHPRDDDLTLLVVTFG